MLGAVNSEENKIDILHGVNLRMNKLSLYRMITFRITGSKDINISGAGHEFRI